MFQDLNPLNRPTAFSEIAIMLIIAALLGYLIGYVMQKLKSDKLKSDLRFSDDKYLTLNNKFSEIEKENKDFEKLIGNLRNRKANILTELDELKKQHDDLADKLAAGSASDEGELKKLQDEISRLTEENKQLNSSIQNQDQTDDKGEIDRLKKEIAKYQSKKNAKTSSGKIENEAQKELSSEARKEIKSSLLKSIGNASESDKDDLTEISGIGPLIEAKLNSIDIFTFKQVASFTENDIAHVTDLIQFFPGRIERDDWVNQAKKLA